MQRQLDHNLLAFPMTFLLHFHALYISPIPTGAQNPSRKLWLRCRFSDWWNRRRSGRGVDPSFVIICLLAERGLFACRTWWFGYHGIVQKYGGLVERNLPLACFSLIKGRDVQVLHFCFAQVRPARSADGSFCATRRRPGCSWCSWCRVAGGPVHFSINCFFVWDKRNSTMQMAFVYSYCHKWFGDVAIDCSSCAWNNLPVRDRLVYAHTIWINLTHANEFPWRPCWSPCGFGRLSVSRCWFEWLAEEVWLKLA